MCAVVLSSTLIFHCTFRHEELNFDGQGGSTLTKGRSDLKLHYTVESSFLTTNDYMFSYNRGYARERGSSHTLETMIDEPTVHADPRQINNAPNQFNKPRG